MGVIQDRRARRVAVEPRNGRLDGVGGAGRGGADGEVMSDASDETPKPRTLARLAERAPALAHASGPKSAMP